MKYLIVGLGNPGSEYENTRHNIGFKMLDRLASLSNISFFKDRYADICDVMFKGRKLILVKPSTFMNLSAKAVKYWMQKSKVKQEKILVITDDISLPFGGLQSFSIAILFQFLIHCFKAYAISGTLPVSRRVPTLWVWV
jgi:PTH1 family peptidyl-tRNA hydrolase